MNRYRVVIAWDYAPGQPSLIGLAISESQAKRIARWHIARLREDGCKVTGKGPWTVRRPKATAVLEVKYVAAGVPGSRQ